MSADYIGMFRKAKFVFCFLHMCTVVRLDVGIAQVLLWN